jgi:aspartate kinase
MNNFNRVAKFGGTSAAQPEAIYRHVQHEQPSVVVVSAPGANRALGIGTRVTQMLHAQEAGRNMTADIQQRFQMLIAPMAAHVAVEPLQDVVDAIPDDLAEWQRRDQPIAALGEYWSSRMYAKYLGREWIDGGALMRVNSEGGLDLEASEAAIRARIQPGSHYVVPGFYGADANGTIRTLGPGTGDVPGAVIARALGLPYYDNYSDVDGFMTQDPNRFPDAALIRRLSLRRVLEMAQNGCNLLHPDVCHILSGTSVQVTMRNTLGDLGNQGTIVQCDGAALAPA